MAISLKIGDQAPQIYGTDQHGKPISLEQYKGKKLILYFYPKDDTPGCTAEACDFRDNYQQLLKMGFEVLGVSVDDQKSHQKFVSKYDLPFTLLSDTEQKTVSAYGVWAEKNLYGKTYMGTVRTTFVIDENGIISHIINKVDTKNSSKQVLDLLTP